VIIACPNCLTRFQLDATRLPQPRPSLRCSRCQHTFPGPWAASSATAPSKPRRTRTPPPESVDDTDTPSFSFEEDEDWQADAGAELPEEDRQFSLDVEDMGFIAPPARAAEAPLSTAAVPPGTTPTKTAKAAALVWDDGEDDVESPTSGPAAEKGSMRISLRPVLILLVIVVGAYAVLARTLYANPKWADEIVRRVPVVGTGLNNQLLNDQVDLIKVEGSYQRTKEGRTFFLITGQALNTSAVPLTQVQVVARLVDHNGTVLQEKPTFCGSAVPVSVLRDLSLHAMEIIPHLKPSDHSVIHPGERSPFVIVFTDIATPIAEFTAEVVAAQRQA
jgi:predicted Zn finger-like uncharacterized protein